MVKSVTKKLNKIVEPTNEDKQYGYQIVLNERKVTEVKKNINNDIYIDK